MSPVARIHQSSSVSYDALTTESLQSHPQLNCQIPELTFYLVPPIPTPKPLEERDGWSFVTLTVTKPFSTYTTTILLGDTFPTSSYITPVTTPDSQPQPVQQPITPGIATGTIVGIVVGCTLGFLLLVGVFYIYLLRAKQYRRRKGRSRSRSKSRSSSGAGGSGSVGGRLLLFLRVIDDADYDQKGLLNHLLSLDLVHSLLHLSSRVLNTQACISNCIVWNGCIFRGELN